MKRPTKLCSSRNPYISEGSESEWPAGLPMPKVLFRRPQPLSPNEHLELVCRVERTGVVGDVIFDLRHPKLDPMGWIAESLLKCRRATSVSGSTIFMVSVVRRVQIRVVGE
jgi:hypothetical protein